MTTRLPAVNETPAAARPQLAEALENVAREIAAFITDKQGSATASGWSGELSEDEALLADGCMSIRDAAKWLGLGEEGSERGGIDGVRAMIERGELRVVRIGGRVLVPRRALLKASAKNLDKPRSKKPRETSRSAS